MLQTKETTPIATDKRNDSYNNGTKRKGIQLGGEPNSEQGLSLLHLKLITLSSTTKRMELDYPDSMYYLIVSMRLRTIKRNPCLKEETHYQQGIELLLTMGLTLQTGLLILTTQSLAFLSRRLTTFTFILPLLA